MFLRTCTFDATVAEKRLPANVPSHLAFPYLQDFTDIPETYKQPVLLVAMTTLASLFVACTTGTCYCEPCQ